jgi:hypothetical protein
MVIGKRATAAILLPLETEYRLFPPGAPTNSWYEFLAHRMDIGTERWRENRLDVITFNYDRSFEHYFSRVIAQRTRVALDMAFSCFTSVRMVHVHGTLGDYPNDLTYGATLGPDAVKRAAQRILVVSEVDDTLPTFDQAHELLRNARRITFLGFGFHRDNVRRLRFFDQPMPDDHKVDVTGTAIGITNEDWQTVRDTVLRGRWSGNPYRCSLMEFLVHYAQLA